MNEPLARDLTAAARLKGRFTLCSGRLSDECFDKSRFESNPALLTRIAQRMIPFTLDADVLVGLELGGVPIATALSIATGRSLRFARKRAKDYGTCQVIEAEVCGLKAVLIEDVITTGGAVAEAANHMRAAGAEVIRVVCAIWRGEGDPRIVGQEGLPVVAMFTRADLAGDPGEAGPTS